MGGWEASVLHVDRLARAQQRERFVDERMQRQHALHAQQHWKTAQLKLNALLGVERVLALHALIDESLALLGTGEPVDVQD